MIRPRPEVPPHDTVRRPRGGGLLAAARVPRGVTGLSSLPMQEFLSAIRSDASSEEIAAIPIPEVYRAAHVRRDEVGMFDGLESAEKDPRKSDRKSTRLNSSH